MDDLDDLLDEVEKKILNNHSSPAKGRSNVLLQGRNKTTNNQQKCDELDEAVNSILDDDEQDITPGKKLSKGNRKSSQSTTHAKRCGNEAQTCPQKCYPLYIGGSNMEKGLNTMSVQRACNTLRCLSCDFKVLYFDNLQWSPSVNYLYFRNNVPDTSKLRTKLQKSTGVLSYCCQCSWKSVKKPTLLTQYKDLKWVCGKHSH